VRQALAGAVGPELVEQIEPSLEDVFVLQSESEDEEAA
jgi:hypothetical protein